MRIGAVLLLLFAVMWFGALLQNLVLFFSSIAGLIFLIGRDSWPEINVGAKSIFFRPDCFLAKIFQNDYVRIRISANRKIVWLAGPLLKNRTVGLIQRRINSGIEQGVRVSGKSHSPRFLVQQSTAFVFLSLFVLVPASVVLGLFVNHYLFFAWLGSFFWVVYPRLKVFLVASERKSAIDDEMAFFTIYASVMQSVGVSLYDSMTGILGGMVFPSIENEAKMIARNVRIFGMDHLGALNECGYSHPNFYFKSLLLGYVSISKSGGDLSRYMERKSQEFFARIQFKYANYKSQAHVIGETLLILLTILPTMILVSSFMLAEDSVKTVMGVSLVLIPLVTIFTILMICMSQPRNHNLVSFDFRAVVVGGICAVVLLLAGHEPWVIVGVSVSASAVFGYIRCLGQFREIALAESALAEFLRDITEYRKIGIPIPNALIRISKERRYNRYFDGMLGAISAGLKRGMNLAEIAGPVLIRSWVAKTALFVLAKVAESGGGTAAVLEQMTNFAAGIEQAKKEMHASISVISYFAFLSPVMMAYTAREMIGVLARVNSGLDQMTSDVFVGTMQVSGETVGAINLLIIVSAVGIGLVMCKLVHFTIKYTIPLGVAVLIAVVSILVLPFFPSLVKI